MLSAISRASAYAASSSSSGSRTRRTSPPASASSASNTRPVATHSIAWPMPTTRGRNQLEHASGTIPRRAKTKPILAPSAARRMSIGSVMVAPTPTAGPLMAAITGLVESKMRRVTMPPPSRGTSPSAARSRQSNVSPPRGEVGARAEAASRAGDDDRTHVVVGVRVVEGVEQLVAHRLGERVESFGPVERDGQDVVGDLVADLFERHPHIQPASGRSGTVSGDHELSCPPFSP